MAISVSDVESLVKDYSRNQNLTDARAIRAIDSAMDMVQSTLGIPEYEKVSQFDFLEDQDLYASPTDVQDYIFIRFDDDNLNRQKPFSFRSGEFLWPRIKAVSKDTRLWGNYDSGGSRKMIILAPNSVASLVIDSFDDAAATWVASNDATNLANDLYVKEEGSASLSFDINTSLSGLDRATITKTSAGPYDMSPQVDTGHFKFYLYLQSVTNFTSVSFSWGSSASNYYQKTVTTQEDGTAFVVGWNKLDFYWNGASQVGTPVVSGITYFRIDLDYTASFASGNHYRVDYLRLVTPDKMDMTYYTSYKGKTAGGTYISTLTATTDTFLFTDTTIKQLVALFAAIIINPQILVDDTSVKALYKSFQTYAQRRYPRKRSNNLIADPQVARTTNA